MSLFTLDKPEQIQQGCSTRESQKARLTVRLMVTSRVAYKFVVNKAIKLTHLLRCCAVTIHNKFKEVPKFKEYNPILLLPPLCPELNRNLATKQSKQGRVCK